MPAGSGAESGQEDVLCAGVQLGTCRTRPQWVAFATAYPTIATMIEHAKQGNYKKASWKLQGFESDVMIGGACEQIRLKYPALPVLTIHDSLMVPGEMEREVEKVILSQWEEFGGTPKIDTKPGH